MQFDLRFLRHACAVAEHGSFSRAADALGVSQPTLSRSIKALEERVGLQLFIRDRSGIAPTDFGAVFLQYAVDVIARASDLEHEVALARGLQAGEVGLGLGPYPAEILALRSALCRRLSRGPPARRQRRPVRRRESAAGPHDRPRRG